MATRFKACRFELELRDGGAGSILHRRGVFVQFMGSMWTQDREEIGQMMICGVIPD